MRSASCRPDRSRSKPCHRGCPPPSTSLFLASCPRPRSRPPRPRPAPRRRAQRGRPIPIRSISKNQRHQVHSLDQERNPLRWSTQAGLADLDGLTAVVPTAVTTHGVGALRGVAAIAQRPGCRLEAPVGGPTAAALRLGGLALGNSHEKHLDRGGTPHHCMGVSVGQPTTIPPRARRMHLGRRRWRFSGRGEPLPTPPIEGREGAPRPRRARHLHRRRWSPGAPLDRVRHSPRDTAVPAATREPRPLGPPR